jgi:hypothetical protein
MQEARMPEAGGQCATKRKPVQAPLAKPCEQPSKARSTGIVKAISLDDPNVLDYSFSCCAPRR